MNAHCSSSPSPKNIFSGMGDAPNASKNWAHFYRPLQYSFSRSGAHWKSDITTKIWMFISVSFSLSSVVLSPYPSLSHFFIIPYLPSFLPPLYSSLLVKCSSSSLRLARLLRLLHLLCISGIWTWTWTGAYGWWMQCCLRWWCTLQAQARLIWPCKSVWDLVSSASFFALFVGLASYTMRRFYRYNRSGKKEQKVVDEDDYLFLPEASYPYCIILHVIHMREAFFRSGIYERS